MQTPSTEPASGSAAKRRPSLTREIVLVLLIKLALIMIIKQVFFSHPMSKAERAAHLQAMIDQPTATASPTHSPTTHPAGSNNP